jgi:hypothetical protein
VLGELVLPHELVRTADDPERVPVTFLQSSYEAAADYGGWDRATLERRPPSWTRHFVARADTTG